jgi:hypothetical protein
MSWYFVMGVTKRIIKSSKQLGQNKFPIVQDQYTSG